VNTFLSHEIRFFFVGENVNSGFLVCDTAHTSLVGTTGFWRNLQLLWRSQWEEGAIDSPLPLSARVTIMYVLESKFMEIPNIFFRLKTEGSLHVRFLKEETFDLF
jgi:hypothetical protein